MGFSRIYTGMHSLIDVIGGVIIGALISYIHWHYGIPFLENSYSNGLWLPYAAPVFGILALLLHPDPKGPCPCFDDSIASVSAAAGSIVGNWMSQQFNKSYNPVYRGWTGFISRMVIGFLVVLIWRWTVKTIMKSNKTDNVDPKKLEGKSVKYQISRTDTKFVRTVIVYGGIGWLVAYGIPGILFALLQI
ncbi:hypothetical protein HK096_008057 [Nowakowskiella sp. JEL0078]|nr:hypothetical protein HK096_008057 [Nowakowskiella sp. JEL0078]